MGYKRHPMIYGSYRFGRHEAHTRPLPSLTPTNMESISSRIVDNDDNDEDDENPMRLCHIAHWKCVSTLTAAA